MFQSEKFWLCVGFAGQIVFTARFMVQWIASERRGESVIPLAFWYLSVCGGWLLLLYACWRRDPVIITGQIFGVAVYSRNLVLVHRKSAREREKQAVLPMQSSSETSSTEVQTFRKAG